ncbi:hypothetical protein D7030_07105 [Flavobacteriaceae bacterium AU392]|nr:hypothetical protein D1817_01315 [Flavobacteriaceae bacterium]RKM84895.1 hypothetical protein D7030_07105 [Flavobacteriaceae bacterium AU392]
MIKQLGVYFISFALLSLIGYYLHTIALSQLASESPISLKYVYIFFGGFSLLLCANFSLLSRTEKFKDQLGFLYLVSVALKILLFCIVFSKHIFIEASFMKKETLNLLIPMILMLVLEVFFVSKLLNYSTPLKNAE